MEYLHVLSRPKVIDQEHDVVWTEAYIDSTVSPRAPGGAGVPLPWESSPVSVPGHSHCISVLRSGVLIFSCAVVCARPPGNQGCGNGTSLLEGVWPAPKRTFDRVFSGHFSFLSRVHKRCPCSSD